MSCLIVQVQVFAAEDGNDAELGLLWDGLGGADPLDAVPCGTKAWEVCMLRALAAWTEEGTPVHLGRGGSGGS